MATKQRLILGKIKIQEIPDDAENTNSNYLSSKFSFHRFSQMSNWILLAYLFIVSPNWI